MKWFWICWFIVFDFRFHQFYQSQCFYNVCRSEDSQFTPNLWQQTRQKTIEDYVRWQTPDSIA
ncbi:hypothetical protein Lalb_Chr05g0226781 [Lupinus albus]|uniref:Uncharacterized protein n=1 Tax=Lupinus albus TaxID=3870 RepID=A0A6A4QK57_LUPAL|nr:hypothetical protein Lalb_Chr05g0226781 [Lupinus albus]